MTRARDVANLIGSGNYSSTTFTATAGQTAFTISHTQGFVQVFMNGLLLDETVDYTSNGTAITLTSGAAAGDEIEVVAYNTFSVGDAIPASGGTFTGEVLLSAANNDPQNLSSSANSGVAVRTDGRLHVGAWQQRAAAFGRGGTDGEIVTFRKDGSTIGEIGTVDGDMYVGTGDTGLFFSDANNQIRPYNTTTKNSVDAAIDIGRTTSRFKDLYLSGGAYLGGTGAANHLDDYEEGTWTPYIGDLGGNNATMTTQNGKYIKIGSLVIANFGCTMSSKGSMTGNYTFIKGIPFNHTGSNAGTAMINRFNRLSGDISSLGMEIGGGIGSAAWFTDVAGLGATGDGYLSVSQINNNFFVQGTLVYTIV